jgi:TRAP transporter TAXI family solute receptor
VGTAFADAINLNIVSGNPGGTYYYIGAAIASILSQKLPDVEVTTTATTGSPLENGTYTSRSTDTMGIFTLDGAYTAIKGDTSRGFREPLTNLGMLVGGHELLLYAITLNGSGIKSHGDVKGKKIGIPVLGNTAYYQTVALLEEYGLKENKDYKSYPMTYAEQTDALKDGAIDVAYTGGGIPKHTPWNCLLPKMYYSFPLTKIRSKFWKRNIPTGGYLKYLQILIEDKIIQLTSLLLKFVYSQILEWTRNLHIK